MIRMRHGWNADGTRECIACHLLMPRDSFSLRHRIRPSGKEYVYHSGRCKECVLLYHRTMSPKYRTKDKMAIWGKTSTMKLRRLVFGYYGLECAACLESDFDVLTIDHINNNGASHRKEIATQSGIRGPGGHRLYHWLKRNSFPVGFQTLCQNCNVAKHKNGGTVPLRRIKRGSKLFFELSKESNFAFDANEGFEKKDAIKK